MSEKNIQSILLAIQKAKASITLLGKGPLKQEMIDLSRSLHLDVKFIDSLPNPKIPELMSKHRLFIIASHYEGNPKVLLEAMACEMPCIASNIPEHADIIENEKEGLLVPAIPGALSQAINRLLDAPDLGKEMGRRARNKILNHYSLKSNALKESQIYQAFSKKKNTC
ncbi:MAG: Glycosyl transferase, group 1 [Candidatus Magnetoglobus multicellularis str. Araruama]|uniref:Glycosyl transferase, group 1 n=1 Tax=Candidatus Magnetoglobus multicellularis str. Araruama TaxID=890399 RepID=A0A1V1PFK1_9BACT|nr:MAG: Glycosyl transferase, group 1 [Candidatus Magnetoglobus multicellularis str. Araruama]